MTDERWADLHHAELVRRRDAEAGLEVVRQALRVILADLDEWHDAND